MIHPSLFTNEEKTNGERRQGMMGTMLTMFMRNLKGLASEIASKTIFKVKVEGNDTETVLRKILGLMHSISASLKMGQTSSPQKIAIKTTDLVTLNKSIEDLLRQIAKKEMIVNMPKVTQVTGSVTLKNPAKEYDFDKIRSDLYEIRRVIGELKLEAPPQAPIKFPDIKIPEFPKAISLTDTKAILKALKDVSDKLEKLPKEIATPEFPTSVKVSNFPPQKYPLPVTNININPLRGSARSRNITVTASPTGLPSDSLAYRRSLVFYNNGSVTVFVGGSDVTVTNGVPVPASTWSPAFDAGPKMTIYGVTSTGTCDVRVLELSNEDVGG